MNSLRISISLLIMLTFSWVPFLPREAAGHGITNPWVHQHIAKKALWVWQDCPDEIRNHGTKEVTVDLDPLTTTTSARYNPENGDDIIVGSGEEDLGWNPIWPPSQLLPIDNENRNGFMEHLWNPDIPNIDGYSGSTGSTANYIDGYNNGVVFGNVQYDSAYRLAQDLWDNKVIRLYREGKWENNPDKINEAYYWLGRVAHLLTDMTVPAHAHCLAHPDFPIMEIDYADYFETYFDSDHPQYILKYVTDVNIGPEYRFESLPNMSDFDWSRVHRNPSNIFRLFWYTAQKTQYFASRSKNDLAQEAVNINYMTISGEPDHFRVSLWNGEGVTIIGNPADIPSNLDKMADALIPHAMKAVAGLYRLFWFEANLIKWRFPIESTGYTNTPTISKDGTIYCPSGNRLLSINPDGNRNWSFAPDGGSVTTPSVDVKGNIYFQSSDALYALNSNGSLLWKFPADASWVACGMDVAIDNDMSIYAQDGGGRLVALNSLGEKKWVIPSGSQPAIGPGGTLYIINLWWEYLLAINKSDGSQLWRAYFNPMGTNGRINPPVIGRYGDIYVNVNGLIQAFNSNGNKAWEYTDIINYSDLRNPVTGVDGSIYYYYCNSVLQRSFIHNISQNGFKKWDVEAYNNAFVPSVGLAVGDDGSLYVNGTFGLRAFNQNGTLLWGLDTNSVGYTYWGSLSMGDDGTLYVLGFTGSNPPLFLYAIRASGKYLQGSSAWPTNTTGPAKSSWPMYGANPQHTFRANLGVPLPFLNLLLAD